MNLLIDYDNVLAHHKKPNLVTFMERILSLLELGGVSIGTRAHVRLYGGWYEGNSLSKKAQQLAGELANDFPRVFRSAKGGAATRVTSELAFSLDIDPSTHFHHTFRRQTPPDDVRCEDPRFLGCTEVNCPVLVRSRHLQIRQVPAIELLKADRGFSLSGVSETGRHDADRGSH